MKVVGGQLYIYNPDPLIEEVLGYGDAWKIVVLEEKNVILLS